MIWVAGGVFGLGTVLGMTLRFPAFVAALLVAGLIVLSRDVVSETGVSRVVFDEIEVFVLLQLGYGLGIGLRTLLQIFRKPRKVPAKPEMDRHLRGRQP